jgi:flagellar hook assembly protein FlgD
MSIDIVRKRGDTRRVTFKIADSYGSSVNLTNWSNFIMTVNSEANPVDDTNQVAQQTGIMVDAKAGRVAFVCDGTVPIGDYYYDVQATDANSEITTLVDGRYTVAQDITKV